MSGSNAGTGQPLCLKCSKCKLKRDEHGRTKRGNLVRTGRTRPRQITAHRHGHLRIGDTAHQLLCTECGHVGWYCHKDAERKPHQLSAT